MTAQQPVVPQKAGQCELDVLFPEKSVDIGSGVSISMHPISIENLSKVLGSFARLAQLKADGTPDAQIAIVCMNEIISMLPYCTDTPMSKIPHYAFPDILTAFMEQNMTDSLVGKWSALAEKMDASLQLSAEQGVAKSQKVSKKP